jgi:gem associated protein 2
MGDAAAPDGGSKRRRVYWRLEIEALKGSPSLEAQAQLWAEVYSSLAAAGFAGEYDGLLAVEERRNRRGNKGKGPEEVAGGGGGRKAPRFLGTAPLLASDTENPSSVKKNVVSVCVLFSADVVGNGEWRNGDLWVRDDRRSEAVQEPAGVYGEIQEPFDEGEVVEYEDDSDDEYVGILKPAFEVDGEPDFESGEPLDGFEYLRRVR